MKPALSKDSANRAQCKINADEMSDYLHTFFPSVPSVPSGSFVSESYLPLTKCHLRKCRQKYRNRKTTDRNTHHCNTKTMRFIRERHPIQTQAACIRAVKTYQQHRKRHHNKTQKDTFCGLKGIILHRRKPSANAHIRQKQTYTIDCQTFILAHFSLRYLPA